jgi:hypothetical protein
MKASDITPRLGTFIQPATAAGMNMVRQMRLIPMQLASISCCSWSDFQYVHAATLLGIILNASTRNEAMRRPEICKDMIISWKNGELRFHSYPSTYLRYMYYHPLTNIAPTTPRIQFILTAYCDSQAHKRGLGCTGDPIIIG